MHVVGFMFWRSGCLRLFSTPLTFYGSVHSSSAPRFEMASSFWKGVVGLGLFALAHAAFSAAQREFLCKTAARVPAVSFGSGRQIGSSGLPLWQLSSAQSAPRRKGFNAHLWRGMHSISTATCLTNILLERLLYVLIDRGVLFLSL